MPAVAPNRLPRQDQLKQSRLPDLAPPARLTTPPSSSLPIRRPSMATPRHHLLLLVLATLAAVSLARAPVPGPGPAALVGGPAPDRGPLLGGWSPIPDVADKHIQELGGWALGQAKYQRLAADGLRFRRVVRGEEQVVSGMNYRLYVDAADPAGRTVPYVAVVYEQVWTQTRKLASFTPAPRRAH